MNYKKQLKSRIKKIIPSLKLGKIKLRGESFTVVVKNLDINLKQIEHELVEKLSMPGLTLIGRGEQYDN
tara:strand:+ start:267 stop:473 length:207 start_codon:yes stop_codon:yes gene_type:complete